MKKLFAIILALAMTFALSAVAIAQTIDSDLNGNGKITVVNAAQGAHYTLYKIFDSVGFPENNVASYTYTKHGDTDAFLTELQGDSSPFTLTATATADEYLVVLKDTKTITDIVTFLKTATLTGLTVGTSTTNVTPDAGDNTLVFDKLTPGYYYITSDLNNGTAVTITNAELNQEVIDKNEPAGIDTEKGKLLWDGSAWASSRDAQIGTDIKYVVTAHVPKYTQATEPTQVDSYTITDALPNGLTLDGDTVKVYISATPPSDPTAAGTTDTLDFTGWQEITSLATIANPSTENNNTLTVTFNTNLTSGTGENAWNYPSNAYVRIVYTAKLNINAVDANTNTASLSRKVGGTDYNIGSCSATVNTYDFSVIKIAKDANDQEVNLNNAHFKLYKELTCTNEIKVSEETGTHTPDLPNGTTVRYRVIENQTGGTGVEIVAGKANVYGLADGTYFLKEITAPANYNALTEPVEIKIDNGVVTYKLSQSDNAYTSGSEGIKVLNQQGNMLPETGGIGTTIFYIIGGLLMVGAAVLLVVRKKMSVME